MRTFIVILLLIAFLVGCAGLQNQWYYQRYTAKYTKANKWSNNYTSQLSPLDIYRIYNAYNSINVTEKSTTSTSSIGGSSY